MWELDHKQSWAPKNWWFWTVVLEKTPESPLDSKEIKPVNPKGNQSWIFIGRTDAEAETPILWSPDVKNWLNGKDPAAGKDWRQEEKGMTEDEMVGWHHQLDGHESEQVPWVGDGQGSLACCSPWGHGIEHDWTTELKWYYSLQWLLQLAFLGVFPSLHTLSGISCLGTLMMAILTSVTWDFTVALISISLITSNEEHLFMYLLASCMSSPEKCLFMSSINFLIGLFLLMPSYF